MVAGGASLEHGFGLFLPDALHAQRESEFAPVTNREDWMKKIARRSDGHQGDAEVIVQVLVLRLVINGGMAQGVPGGLVDPGVKGGHIDVKDLLPWVSLMVKGHSPSSSTKEGISGLKGWRGCQ